MDQRTLLFTGPGEVEVRRGPVPDPEPGQVRVRTVVSAVSAGTERLVYRGEAPPEGGTAFPLPVRFGDLRFPLSYGYSAVGTVEALGRGVAEKWLGRRVFAFHPHQSHFLTSTDSLLVLPEQVSDRDAVFLPNMETAVNLIMDGTPVLGERVMVFGQGVVGLLTTALLARFPIAALAVVDRYPLRRRWAQTLGAHVAAASVHSHEGALLAPLLEESGTHPGADLCYELTGEPDVLNEALAVTGFAGRIVIGSWYGTRRASLDLGGRFHRSRIRLLSSQVSSVDPRWSGRWDKKRRMQTVLRLLEEINPARLITHPAPLEQAPEMYRMLEEKPQDVLQIIFEYAY